jgi:hypothetical protein
VPGNWQFPHAGTGALDELTQITHLHPNPCADCAQPDRHRTRGLKDTRAIAIPSAPGRAKHQAQGACLDVALSPVLRSLLVAAHSQQCCLVPQWRSRCAPVPDYALRKRCCLRGGLLARLPPASLVRGPRAHFLRTVSKFAPLCAGHRAAAVCHVRRFSGYRQHYNKSHRCGRHLCALRTQAASEAHCTLPHACLPCSRLHRAGWPSFHALLCAAELRRGVAQMSSRSGCSFSGWSLRQTATWQHRTWCAAALTSLCVGGTYVAARHSRQTRPLTWTRFARAPAGAHRRHDGPD